MKRSEVKYQAHTHLNQTILTALSPFIPTPNPTRTALSATPSRPSLSPVAVYLDQIYSIARDAYEEENIDLIRCALNEITRVCTEFFYEEDGR